MKRKEGAQRKREENPQLLSGVLSGETAEEDFAVAAEVFKNHNHQAWITVHVTSSITTTAAAKTWIIAFCR